MLDGNNYPDEKSLEEIKNWNVLAKGVDGLLDLIYENTNWADRQIYRGAGKEVIRYEYHTGGWSGNEDVIQAMKHNFLFWSLSWEMTKKGGHYYFMIKKKQYGW